MSRSKDLPRIFSPAVRKDLLVRSSMLRASQAASRSVLAPLGRMGSRVPGIAMQRSGFSTAAAATAVPRAMAGPMTGRMAGTGAVSAGQVLAGARRNATTEVGQEGAYANLRQRTGEFSPSSVYAKCCCRGVPSCGEGRMEADSFRVELGGLGRLRTNSC